MQSRNATWPRTVWALAALAVMASAGLPAGAQIEQPPTVNDLAQLLAEAMLRP